MKLKLQFTASVTNPPPDARPLSRENQSSELLLLTIWASMWNILISCADEVTPSGWLERKHGRGSFLYCRQTHPFENKSSSLNNIWRMAMIFKWFIWHSNDSCSILGTAPLIRVSKTICIRHKILVRSRTDDVLNLTQYSNVHLVCHIIECGCYAYADALSVYHMFICKYIPPV